MPDALIAEALSDAAGFATEGEVKIQGLDDHTRLILFIGIGIYILGILAIGWWSSKRVQNVGDYLVAGRRLPLWMATATLLATWFGAGSSMGVAAQVYSPDGGGISGVIADPFAAAFSLIFAGVFIVGLLRRKRYLTVTDIIEDRYGKAAGIYASFWMLPVYIGWLGAQVMGLGTILYVLTGVSVMWGVVIGTAVVLVYTYAGGMWAVTLTDVVQVSLIIVGLFLLVPQAVDMAGGWEATFATVPAGDLTLMPETSGAENWIYYFGQWLVMGLGCTVGQDLIQRSLASRNEKIAIASSVMSGAFYLTLALVPITIGFAARVVFARHGITADALGDNLENQVLPRMAILGLGNIHPIVLTVFLAALISAIMSSADSSLLAASSLLSNNIVKPMCRHITDEHLLLVTRIASVALILLSALLALSVKSIYQLMINSWASQLVVVFVPVMTALYVKRASRNCAWTAMVVAPVVWLAYVFVKAAGLNTPFLELIADDGVFSPILTIGAVYGFAAGILAFFFTWCGERLTARCAEGEE